jgi:hypothetical protein
MADNTQEMTQKGAAVFLFKSPKNLESKQNIIVGDATTIA